MKENNQQKPVYIITCLGTGNYTPCCYTTSDWDSGVVTFIQTAVCKYWRDKQNRPISAKIFCTNEATVKHWNVATSISNKTLPDELKEAGFQEGRDFEKIDITKDPFSEDVIWDILSLSSEHIPEEANIVFDITHAFRSLPMIMAVLLNYLTVTKHVKLIGCHYGAFENLAQKDGTKLTVQDIKDHNIPEDERKALFVSIERIFELNAWAQAVHDFQDLGNGRALHKLAKKCVNDSKRNVHASYISQNKKEHQFPDSESLKDARNINNLATAICNFSTNVLNNRLGNKEGIQNTHFTQCLKVNDLSIDKDGFMHALIPLLKTLSTELTNKLGLKDPEPKQEGALNGIRAAYWAYTHDLTPQALTLLQEAIISFFLEPPSISSELQKYEKKFDKRDFLSCVLTWGCQGSEKDFQINNDENPKETAKTAKIIKKEIEKMLELTLKPINDSSQSQKQQKTVATQTNESLNTPYTFWQLYSTIIQKRNDINHAGTRNGTNKSLDLSKDFWTNLFQIPCFQELQTLL